jgi:hypothetical protein
MYISTYFTNISPHYFLKIIYIYWKILLIFVIMKNNNKKYILLGLSLLYDQMVHERLSSEDEETRKQCLIESNNVLSLIKTIEETDIKLKLCDLDKYVNEIRVNTAGLSGVSNMIKDIRFDLNGIV